MGQYETCVHSRAVPFSKRQNGSYMMINENIILTRRQFDEFLRMCANILPDAPGSLRTLWTVPLKLAFVFTVCVFGSCFGALTAVNLVSEFSCLFFPSLT